MPIHAPAAAEIMNPPDSPFFQPSTRRSSVLVRSKGGGEAEEVPLTDVEKKSSLLGAYFNLCNVTIGAGIVGLVSYRSCAMKLHMYFYCDCIQSNV